MNGTITITSVGNLKVHTYTSPDNGWSVNSHIIEFSTQLFIVDAQLLIPYGKEVADYAAELNKPLTRLYVTHHHPDHFFGATAFPVKISSLAQTAGLIDTVGNIYASVMYARLGALVPSKSPAVEIIIEAGAASVDDVTIEFIHLKNAETEDALMIGFPDHGILITQDMLYNQIHPYLGDKAFDHWIEDINHFKKKEKYIRVLPGHGAPGGAELYDRMLKYLAAAKKAYDDSLDFSDFVRLISAAMPAYHNDSLLKLSGRYLFPKEVIE